MNKQSWLSVGHGVVGAGMALVGVMSLAAFAGRWDERLDLLSHFRVVFTGLSAAAVLYFLLARRRRVAAACLALALLNAAQWAPFLRGNTRAAAGPSLTVFMGNIHSINPSADRLLATIERIRPEVVVLLEVNARWMDALQPLASAYPYRVGCPREDNFGILMMSRLPLQNARVLVLGRAQLPSVYGEVELDGRRLALLGTHPLPPLGAGGTALRDDQLRAIAQFVREGSLPWIVVGDLNATPWSYALKELTRTTGLRRASASGRLLGTWPTALGWFRLPIDHALLSNELAAVRIETGPDLGSDHLPLLLEAAWAK